MARQGWQQLPSNPLAEGRGGNVRDNVRLVFTFIGCLVLGGAAAATADAIVNPNGSSSGPVVGGLIAGFGLSLILIARLRDYRLVTAHPIGHLRLPWARVGA